MKKRLFAFLTASILVFGVAGLISNPDSAPTFQRELPIDF